MAMVTYVVQHDFYAAALSQSKIKIGEFVDYDSKTRKANYNGTEAIVPQLETALKFGWIMAQSDVGRMIPVAPVSSNSQNPRYSVTQDRDSVISTRKGTQRVHKGSVEPQDEQPVSQVRVFTPANVGTLDLAKGDFQKLTQQNQKAAQERVKLAEQNSQLPKVSYTEGVSVTTTTGNRANRPGSGQVWDGGAESSLVGKVSDRMGTFRRTAAPVAAEEYDQDDETYDNEIYGDEGYDEEGYEDESEQQFAPQELPLDIDSLKSRMNIILEALPKAHQEDIKLHIAILRAILPGFPAWDARAHWKRKVKAYQDQIEVNPNFVTALRLVESEAFWKHIDK
jgi:hypothetical protein